MSKPRIAFIGLGAMGLHMAHILKGAGYDVRGYDVRPEVVQSFHQDDVSRCCKSVSKAAVDADIIILMVVSHHQARSILFAAADGDGDALVNLARGADILLMATCSQEAVISLADDVAKKRPDVGFVDAPVSGGVERCQVGWSHYHGSSERGRLPSGGTSAEDHGQQTVSRRHRGRPRERNEGSESGEYQSGSLKSSAADSDSLSQRCSVEFTSPLQRKPCPWRAKQALTLLSR